MRFSIEDCFWVATPQWYHNADFTWLVIVKEVHAILRRKWKKTDIHRKDRSVKQSFQNLQNILSFFLEVQMKIFRRTYSQCHRKLDFCRSQARLRFREENLFAQSPRRQRSLQHLDGYESHQLRRSESRDRCRRAKRVPWLQVRHLQKLWIISPVCITIRNLVDSLIVSSITLISWWSDAVKNNKSASMN